MGFFSKTTPSSSSTKCSFHVESIEDEKATTEMTVKAHRKLANVLSTSDVQTFKKSEVERSISLFFSISGLPRYKRVIRSPEGSNLSIYADSLREKLVVGGMEEEGGGRISFSGSSRDDQSELSFYQRLIERSATRLPQTIRSCETLRPLCVSMDSPKSSDNFTRIRTPFKSTLSESRLVKKPTYKPYTIEDYRSLPIPKPDRSLGPDKEEILAKREWLMRRRSYGDSVSERNRQQILHTAQRFKSRRIAPRKCFLPSLKHRDTDLKIHTNSSITEKTVNESNDNVERKNHLNRSTKILISKKSTPNSSRKSKKQDKSVKRSINLNSSDHFEDSYLDSLQQRHLREKELVDKLIRQAITS
ncbi:uncharacterized protein LOC122524947 [Polistes fuscatus]|uniref:uncharacterized protein LOC122524947 n=1 Tax=Polistes fuscatus TaxID=30207 RepID=UPI001CA8DF34|nr:uncharacterized protein LOC122524947 [Polistes fuscatus]